MNESDLLLPTAPALEHKFDYFDLFRVRCPWCGGYTDWCISWIAAWDQLSDHYAMRHRDIQHALQDRCARAPARPDAWCDPRGL